MKLINQQILSEFIFISIAKKKKTKQTKKRSPLKLIEKEIVNKP